MKKDFLSIADFSTDELFGLIELSKEVKKHPDNYRQKLQGKSIATIFEKQSLRTHVTFDVGIYQLGAHAIYLTQGDISLGKRESIYDTGKNLERWVDGVVVRTYAHKTCTDLAAAMKIPVINALTDFEHPCQALGDFLTVHEKKWSFSGKKFVFVGDGNNVCHSLMLFAAKVGMNFVANTPKGYEPDKNVIKSSIVFAKKMGSTVEVINDPKEAVKDADVIYTDVWTSMGQEAEKESRLKIFKNYQVNKKLMSLAKSDAIFMHCLPAHRGEEVTDDVIDSKNSVVFDEAENRLHTQKAVMLTLMSGA
ncbi:MAG: ornithine carbamoyltransferase [Ignavibacteriales bacterium]|nr:ornithine carbamoyltransferase [Ignavibacteriales bacterium]